MTIEAPVTLEEILKESLELSLEGMSVTDINFNVKVPAFLKKVSAFFSEVLSNDMQGFSQFNASGMYRTVKDVKHMSVRGRKVIQPKGLDVSYLTYIRALGSVQELTDQLIPETLKPFEAFLGGLLTIPDEARSQIESVKLDSIRLHNVELAKSTYQKNFSKHQAEKRPYGDLVERTVDWLAILNNYNALATRVTSVDRNEVHSYIELIIDHTAKLSANMEGDADAYKVSGITASTLGKFIHSVAEEVELLSLQNYNLITLEESIKAALEIAKSE